MNPVVEYAGFQYEIVPENDRGCRAIPLPGQHPAAGKEKHRRAALEQYLDQSS